MSSDISDIATPPLPICKMCKSDLHPFLAALPKVELHLHLEGTLSPQHLFALALRNGISLPTDDAAFETPLSLQDRYDHFTSLSDFLHYYYIGMSCLITAHDFEELAYNYFVRAKADGAMHCEVFFDPQAHTSRGISYSTVITGFTAARLRAAKELGVTSQLVMCFLRHLSSEDAMAHYLAAEKCGHFADGTLGGIGLDSAEVGNRPELFRDVYERAVAQGVRRTAHAGEEGDASYIAGALDVGAQRIDHGIRLAEDAVLMARVAAEKILLTVCPISNVQLRAMTHVGELPLRRFLDAGVRFNLNSDDPAYFGGYLLDNYCAVQDAFAFGKEEWRVIAQAGIEGCWAEEERKAEMREVLERVCKAFEY